MKITIKVGEHQGREAGGRLLKQERIAHSLLIKVSENTREMIKSFETRRLRTCSWRRKDDNSRAREKRLSRSCFTLFIKSL